MKKILLITNIPNAYRIPLFNCLHDLFTKENKELHVIFAAAGYERRKSKIDLNECRFRYTILDSSPITTGDEEKTYFSYNGLRQALKKEKPDCMIVSGFSPASFKCWWYSLFNKIPLIIWSGSISKKGRNDSFLRNTMRKFLVRNAAAFIAYGSKASSYLESLGAKKKDIYIGINTVDTTYFKQETEKNRLKLIPDQLHHLLYVGYLVPRKEPLKLLEIAGQLFRIRPDFVLDIAGDGSERAKMEEYVRQQKLEKCVKFHGFLQKDELPAIMAKAELFLFQTGFDIWGLTLNEAMAAGITCISSVNAGASDDLIKNETGFILDFRNTDEAVRLIDRLLNDQVLMKKTGDKAKAYIEENASLNVSAQGFIKAVHHALKSD